MVPRVLFPWWLSAASDAAPIRPAALVPDDEILKLIGAYRRLAHEALAIADLLARQRAYLLAPPTSTDGPIP